MNDSGTGPLFRERSAWATAAVVAIANGGALAILLIQPNNPALWIGVFVASVTVQIIALTVLHIAIAVVTPKAPDDERDHAIELRSTRFSGWIMAVGVFLGISALVVQRLVLGENGPTDILLDPLMVAYGLFFFVVVSEVTRLLTQAIDYRRSM